MKATERGPKPLKTPNLKWTISLCIDGNIIQDCKQACPLLQKETVFYLPGLFGMHTFLERQSKIKGQ